VPASQGQQVAQVVVRHPDGCAHPRRQRLVVAYGDGCAEGILSSGHSSRVVHRLASDSRRLQRREQAVGELKVRTAKARRDAERRAKAAECAITVSGSMRKRGGFKQQ
jgi:hypothetical protein